MDVFDNRTNTRDFIPSFPMRPGVVAKTRPSREKKCCPVIRPSGQGDEGTITNINFNFVSLLGSKRNTAITHIKQRDLEGQIINCFSLDKILTI